MAVRYMAVRRTLQSTLVRFARHLYARRGLAEATVHNYTSAIRRLAPAIGLEPTQQAVEREIERMHRAGASYSHIVNTSIAIEAYGAFIGKPIKLGRPRKPRHLVRGTLSEAEVTLLIAAAAQAHRFDELLLGSAERVKAEFQRRITEIKLTPGIDEQGPFYTVSGDVDLFSVSSDAEQNNQVDLIALHYNLPIHFYLRPYTQRPSWALAKAA